MPAKGPKSPKSKTAIAKAAPAWPAKPAEVASVAISQGLTPLEYLLGIVRDETLEQDARMRAANMALPYVHPKLEAAEATGKKAQREAAARTAERGTDWEDLLAKPH